jgi:aspartyl-tRNA(Asn)/glutamyl-tRNA(Gln) amidotransferase subunit A
MRARLLQPTLNACITITEAQALHRAEVLEAELSNGRDRGILHGIPIVHKDCFDTVGIPTTQGSRYFARYVPSDDAAVVKRLREAGCVMIGKANMHELAAGGSGDNAFAGAVRNPWNLDRAAGGSSSGTAAAIAAGIVLGGTGTDSGGSIRAPASWNGIVGIRPSAGIVSKHGCFPRSYSFDCAGPMARTVEDAAILLSAIAGYDPADASSIQRAPENYLAAIGSDVRGLRLGVIADYTFSEIDLAVAKSVEAVVETYGRLGVEMHVIELPVVSKEFNYWALFDILQYEFEKILGPQYYACEDRERLFGPAVRANMERGRLISKETYRRALASRESVVADIRACFRDVDALITPCQPFVAQPFESSEEVFNRVRQFMLPFSFAGLPSISVPCGFDEQGMPIGMQLVCDLFQEKRMIAMANAYALQTNHHLRRPPLFV